MFGRNQFLNLKSYWKDDEPRARYFVQGKGEIKLGTKEFKAQGGEGAVYVKGRHAYKIYADPSRCIAQAKIDELAALVQPNIIRPVHLILDGRSIPAWYHGQPVRASNESHDNSESSTEASVYRIDGEWLGVAQRIDAETWQPRTVMQSERPNS